VGFQPTAVSPTDRALRTMRPHALTFCVSRFMHDKGAVHPPDGAFYRPLSIVDRRSEDRIHHQRRMLHAKYFYLS